MMKGLLNFFIRCFKPTKSNEDKSSEGVKYYEIEQEQFNFSFGPDSQGNSVNDFEDNLSDRV